MSHTLKMLIGCLAPLLLIFALPLFGVSETVSVWLFVILMFGCHLLMMRGGHGSHDDAGPSSDHKKE
ncbi:MAG: hypothetical protein GC160_15505 [Acidobacteria bacterium]|nr:hypothetical protein [Acidobacteriota bacterium]